MDVERTIEFILDQQAQAAANLVKLETQVSKLAEHVDRIDRRMDGITKLIRMGMKWMVVSDERMKKRIGELTEAQRRTDRKLDRLIESWNRRSPNGKGPNGRTGRR